MRIQSTWECLCLIIARAWCILVYLCALCACGRLTPAPTSVSDPTAWATLAVTPALTVTPTLVASPTPAFSPIPEPSSTTRPITSSPEPEPGRILFAEGTISATVISTLQSGGVDLYILRALAGQTLIVDIAAPHPVLLNVWGVDGTVLKEEVGGTTHWQGTLPYTQDYLVELASTGPEIDYQMTITVPRLVEPTPTQSIYRNVEYDFEVRYPSDFAVEATCSDAALMGDPVVSFHLAGPQHYAGTNLVEASVIIGVGQSEEIRATCMSPRTPLEEYLGEKEINSVTFYQVSRVGVATGNVYDVTSYRTLRGNACYEIALFLHFHDVGVYKPGTVSAFDRETVMNRLSQVLYTFRFTE